MLRNIDKQSAESVESVLKKKRKATVGRICRKGLMFKAWNERVRGDELLIIIRINASSITTVQKANTRCGFRAASVAVTAVITDGKR